MWYIIRQMIHKRMTVVHNQIQTQQFLQTNLNDKKVLNIYQYVASDVLNSGTIDDEIQILFRI